MIFGHQTTTWKNPVDHVPCYVVQNVPRLISTILQTFICPESVEQKASPWDEMGFNGIRGKSHRGMVGW